MTPVSVAISVAFARSILLAVARSVSLPVTILVTILATTTATALARGGFASVLVRVSLSLALRCLVLAPLGRLLLVRRLGRHGQGRTTLALALAATRVVLVSRLLPPPLFLGDASGAAEFDGEASSMMGVAVEVVLVGTATVAAVRAGFLNRAAARNTMAMATTNAFECRYTVLRTLA
jgi:hypothetical protein